MNILVTGANGYLGGWVVYELMRDGHRVSCEDSHGRSVSLKPHLSPAPFDIEDDPADVVVHLGWYARAGNGEREVQKECLHRTGELLSRLNGKPRIVFASSAAVYGNGGDHVFKEVDVTLPVCAYGVNKLLAEEMIRQHSDKSLVFRFGALMGKGFVRTKPDVCVNAFAIGGFRHNRIEVWNPDAWKPVLHVRDAAELIRLAVTGGWGNESNQLVLNACCASYRARDLAGVAAGITEGDVIEVGDRTGPRSCRLDCERLDGYAPSWNCFTRTPSDAIKEFRDYTEKPEDRPRIW